MSRSGLAPWTWQIRKGDIMGEGWGAQGWIWFIPLAGTQRWLWKQGGGHRRCWCGCAHHSRVGTGQGLVSEREVNAVSVGKGSRTEWSGHPRCRGKLCRSEWSTEEGVKSSVLGVITVHRLKNHIFVRRSLPAVYHLLWICWARKFMTAAANKPPHTSGYIAGIMLLR